jgi:hypothetical protein
MAVHVLLNGVSRSERQSVISAATEAVQRAGGWVEDVHFFSNLAVNLRCVIAASDAGVLGEELINLGIGLGRDDMVALQRVAAGLSKADELTFSVQITFVHREPDLRRHIPSVPG